MLPKRLHLELGLIIFQMASYPAVFLLLFQISYASLVAPG